MKLSINVLFYFCFEKDINCCALINKPTLPLTKELIKESFGMASRKVYATSKNIMYFFYRKAKKKIIKI